MPTEIAFVLSRKAEFEAQASKDVSLIICLWAVARLMLTALRARFGFDAETARALVSNG